MSVMSFIRYSCLLSAVLNTALVTALPSWAQYVRSPSQQIVRPVSVILTHTSGNVSNPNGLLGYNDGPTTLTRRGITLESWPSGTIASASSYHASRNDNGQITTYFPSNAIDGNTTTFWNDDTEGEYPDVLTVTSPIAVTLPGITVLSSMEGVPIDFEVEALQGGSWVQVGSVTDSAAVQISVPFSSTISTTSIRITVTRDRPLGLGEFTRINEVWPGLADSIPTVVVDFGQVVAGFLSIDFAGASSNKPGIRLAFSETIEFLTDVSDFSRSNNGLTITPGSDQIAVSSTPYVWTDAYGCMNGSKVCSDGLHGFRYLKIYLDALSADFPDTSAAGTVSISDVFLNFTAFLGTPDTFTGWFECSDKSLNQYWYEAAYTNDLCINTFQDNDTDPRGSQSPTLRGKLVLFDGPKRDRDPYVGDLGVAGRTAYLTHDVSISVKNILVDLAIHQRNDGWIPPASIMNYKLTLFEYPLWWVVSSHDLLLYTGDINYVQRVYHNLVAVLDDWYPLVTDTSTDLLSKGLAGTEGYADYAFLSRSGAVAYYNALYVMALNSAADMANASNHTSDAYRWTARAQQVATAMNKLLWDSSVGAYHDTPGSTTHGQDGNFIAILAGVASSSQASSILEYWSTFAQPYGNPFFDNDSLGTDYSKRVYAFLSYFEIAARFASNMGDSAIEETKRLYGWMSTHDPNTTYWEGIGTGGSMYENGFTSAAHGWSTGVLPALTNYLLGVTPTQQGFSRFRVKPMPSGGVTWAHGQVPTPHGPIAVNWTMEAAPLAFKLLVTVPADCQADIAIPANSVADSVTIDGYTAWGGAATFAPVYAASYAAGYVTLQGLPEGDYTIEVLNRSSIRTSATAGHRDAQSLLGLCLHSVLARIFWWWRSDFSIVLGIGT